MAGRPDGRGPSRAPSGTPAGLGRQGERWYERGMKWILALAMLPALAVPSEQCATQLGGKCRPACESGERPEQGAFTDCAEKELCCVPDRATGSASAAPGAAPVVRIDSMAFEPTELKVKVGAEVTWRNQEASIHTVTADDGSFQSPPLEEGKVFKKTFTKAGTYSYTCEMHPFMTGKIVVE